MSVLQPFFFNLLTPTVPDPPTGVSASAGNAQATVSFSAPANNGGAAITSYTATSSPGGFTASGSSSPLTVTGLTNGTSYTFTVYATNSVGNSSNSSPSSSVTPVAPFVAGNIYTAAGSTIGSYSIGWNGAYNILSDGYGNLVWNDYFNGYLYQWNPTGSSITRYTLTGFNPIGFALIPNKLGALVFDRYSAQLYFYDFVYQTATNLGSLPSGSGWGVAVTTSGVAYISNGSGHNIYKYSGWSGGGGSTFNAGSFSLVQSTGINMYGMAGDTSGNYYGFGVSNSLVYQWNSSDSLVYTYSSMGTPYGGSIGNDGNLYVNTYNYTIRKGSGGSSSVIAGTGTSGNSPDGTLATSALIGHGYSATQWSYGANSHVYFPDFTNSKLWMIY